MHPILRTVTVVHSESERTEMHGSARLCHAGLSVGRVRRNLCTPDQICWRVNHRIAVGNVLQQDTLRSAGHNEEEEMVHRVAKVQCLQTGQLYQTFPLSLANCTLRHWATSGQRRVCSKTIRVQW